MSNRDLLALGKWLNENTYTIGKTTRTHIKKSRLWPNGSKLLLLIHTSNCHEIEKDIISLFKIKYVQMKKYGNRYFQGDFLEMRNDIIALVKKIWIIRTK